MEELNAKFFGFLLAFPAQAVLAEMKRTLPILAANWHIEKIQNLYDLYKTGAVKVGIYNPPQKIEVKNWIIKNSNFPEVEVRAFLYTLWNMAKTGMIDAEYWNIAQQKTPAIIRAAKGIPETVESISKSVKWIGIIAIIGIGLYFTWPILRKIRNKTKEKTT